MCIRDRFYHIKQLRIEDQYEATYYAKEQIEIIKRIRQQLIENLDKKISIEELQMLPAE